MFIFVYIITCIILVNSADMDTIVSDEIFDTNRGEKVRKAGKAAQDTPRRFLEDLSDYEFHIAHLKDVKWDTESGRRFCKNTLEDRVKRYKKMLANDPSRLEFVSGDAIPFDEKDLVPEQCDVMEEKREESVVQVERATEEKMERTDTATTPDIKEKDNEKAKKKSDQKARRASEYVFSSVEYYDDVPTFSASSVCPDDVIEIKLEVDVIKPYDMECELMVRWESLD